MATDTRTTKRKGRLDFPTVKNARPKASAYKLADGQGLFLLVKPDGSKSWRFRYRYAGRENMLSFHNWPEASIGDARYECDAARDLLRQGIDPAADKRDKRQARKDERDAKDREAENTFEAVAEDWIETNRAKWSEGQIERIRSSLKRDVFPALGKRPIAEITPAEVLDVIRKVEKRDALEQATRVVQRMTAIFARGVQTLRCPTNPAREMRGVVKKYRVQHRPSLPADKLPEFLQKMDDTGADAVTKAALQLIILTGCRVNEVLQGNWSEIDLDAALWRIPAERMKMRRPHDVPLSEQAVAILKAIKPLASKHGLIFPSPMKPGHPIHNNALLLYLRRMGFEAGTVTVHGFRATFSTWANESGHDPDVIERCLAHQDKNAVRRAYNRAQHLEDRRRLLQDWANFIDAQRKGAEVIPIRRAKR